MFKKLFNLTQSSEQKKQAPVPVIFAEREEGWFIYDSVTLEKSLQETSKKLASIFNNLRGFPAEEKAKYFDATIQRFVNLVGNLPASENHHDSRPYGLMDHTFTATLKAVCLYKDGMGSGKNANPAERRKDLYSVFIGGLLHDIGKIHDMEVFDGANEQWDPVVLGLLPWIKAGNRQQYKFRFKPNRSHKHESLGIFYLNLLVDREILQEIGIDRVMDICHYMSTGLDKSKSQFGEYILRGDMDAVVDYNQRKALEDEKERALAREKAELSNTLAHHDEIQRVQEDNKRKLAESERVRREEEIEKEKKKTKNIDTRPLSEKYGETGFIVAKDISRPIPVIEVSEPRTREMVQIGDSSQIDSPRENRSEDLARAEKIEVKIEGEAEVKKDDKHALSVGAKNSAVENSTVPASSSLPALTLEDRKKLPTGVDVVPQALGAMLSELDVDNMSFDNVSEVIDEEGIVGEAARKQSDAVSSDKGIVPEKPTKDGLGSPGGPKATGHEDVKNADILPQKTLKSSAPSATSIPSTPSTSSTSSTPSATLSPTAPVLASQPLVPTDNQGTMDFAVQFPLAFAKAFESKAILINDLKGSVFYGDRYTMVMMPKGMKGICRGSMEALQACPTIGPFDIEDNTPNINDALKNLGVLYRGEDPEEEFSIWIARIKPDGRSWYNEKKDMWVIFIENEFLWKYVKVRPSKVNENFVVCYGANILERDGKTKKFINYGDMPFARYSDMYRPEDMHKPPMVFNRKAIEVMIEFIIGYFVEKTPKYNLVGGMFFKDDRAVFVAYPKILSVITEYEPFQNYKFPVQRFCPTTIILNKMAMLEKVYVTGEIVQHKIFVPHLGITLGVIGISGRHFPPEFFKRLESKEIKILSSEEWEKHKAAMNELKAKDSTGA